jgi:hypothetical protein
MALIAAGGAVVLRANSMRVKARAVLPSVAGGAAPLTQNAGR